MRAGRLLLLVLLMCTPAWALETDQFTVPPQPLADLGPMLDAKATFELRRVVAAANATRATELKLAAEARSKSAAKLHRDRAYAAVSQQGLAKAYYETIAGGGVPICKIEDWLIDDHTYRASLLQPMPMGNSVYGGNPFTRPLLVVELSPTANLHGQYVGVDKVGHFFQQGHEYYERYIEARCQGATETDATRAAIAVGKKQEHGFYGEALIGIYSNADLAANYTGLLFYRNLLEPVTIFGVTYEPMVQWDGDLLKVTDRANNDLLKPYITEHWNEAMNPCHFDGYWRPFVRDRIAKKINTWMAFNHSTPQLEAARLQRVRTFDGQDYGHSGFRDVITLLNAGHFDAVASR